MKNAVTVFMNGDYLDELTPANGDVGFLIGKLKSLGYELKRVYFQEHGITLAEMWVIHDGTGTNQDITMPREPDIADLANGAATLDDILQRIQKRQAANKD